ncbi:hypothetical protein L841_1897 [Mycobacterium sp. MAC_080597_8934]|nr:hypothetical protein L842_0710 [Mycobacterium intracellulare MIN_052511_1280]ETZ68502.1 hypothetical protein L841_1897 [Mycobacterium sp. MAC_080597_8934]
MYGARRRVDWLVGWCARVRPRQRGAAGVNRARIGGLIGLIEQ